jgi:integrase
MAVFDVLPSGLHRARVRRAGISKSKAFERVGDAKAWARRIESEIERGAWKGPSAAASMTLMTALDKYEKEITPRKRSAPSERSVLHILREDAGALLGTTLDRVTGADLAGLRDKWKHDQVTASTIRRRLALLSHLYGVARKEWRMPGLVNPVQDVRLPSVHDARSRRITDAELKAVCKATESKELANFLRLALATTMRRGEVRALRWENVKLQDRTAWLPAESTKGSKGRFVPLSRAAVAVLKDMTGRKSGPVFRFDPHTYTRAWRRAVDRARTEYIATCKERGQDPDPHFLVDARLHDLRHEGASRYAEEKGFSTIELAAITGHKDLRMLKRYTHPDAREIAKRMG